METPNDFKQPDNMAYHNAKVFAGEYAIPGLKLKDRPLILDIGACCGAFTRWALEQWPQSRITAVEPNPIALEYLRANTSGHGAFICPWAISWTDNKVPLYSGKHNLGEASCFEQGEQSSNYTNVTSCPPTHFSYENYDLIKIDCEGMEAEILKHIPHSVPVIFEWHGVNRLKQCLEALGEPLPDDHMILAPSRGIAYREAFGKVQPLGTEGRYRIVPKEHKEEASQITSRPYIGTPIHYDPTGSFMLSLMSLHAAEPDCKINILLGDAHPDRARNVIVNQFMRTDYQRLIFLDADLKFDQSQIVKLYRDACFYDLDIHCGFYAGKSQKQTHWIANALTDEVDERGFQALKEAGTGCMIIHRRVFSAIEKAHPSRHYIEDSTPDKEMFAYFDSGVRTCHWTKRRRWLSEDWWFCQEAAELGFSITGDTNIILLHEGRAFYPLEEQAVKMASFEKAETNNTEAAS